MNESINKLIQFIVEDNKVTDHPYYVLRLNDNEITLSYTNRIDKDLIKIDFDGNIGMAEFIYEICNRIVEVFKPDEVCRVVEVQNFAGHDYALDKGPLEVIFSIGDNNIVIHFSSISEKNRQWLTNYMHYEDNEKESENTGEFIELNNFLNALEDGEYKNAEGYQGNQGIHHR